MNLRTAIRTALLVVAFGDCSTTTPAGALGPVAPPSPVPGPIHLPALVNLVGNGGFEQPDVTSLGGYAMFGPRSTIGTCGTILPSGRSRTEPTSRCWWVAGGVAVVDRIHAAPSGLQSLRLGSGGSTANAASVQQRVALRAGTRYQLSATVSSVQPGAVLRMGVDHVADSGAVVDRSTTSARPASPAERWTLSFRTGAVVRSGVVTLAALTGVVSFDDLQLRESA